MNDCKISEVLFPVKAETQGFAFRDLKMEVSFATEGTIAATALEFM